MNRARVLSVLDLTINLQVCTVRYILPTVMFIYDPRAWSSSPVELKLTHLGA